MKFIFDFIDEHTDYFRLVPGDIQVLYSPEQNEIVLYYPDHGFLFEPGNLWFIEFEMGQLTFIGHI